jgi:uncharacterized protein involved in exopolysaccharide biosynthesis
MPPSLSETGPRDIYRVVLRHRKKALAFLLFVLVAAGAYVVLAPREYSSSAQLFVRLGRENATLAPEATLGEEAVVTMPSSREEEMNSVVQMLGSRAMIERVVDTLGPKAILDPGSEAPADQSADTAQSGMTAWIGQWKTAAGEQLATARETVRSWMGEKPVPEREEAVRHLAKRIVVDSPRKSNVIAVSYETESPETAQRVVQQLIDVYLQQHARLSRTEGSQEFFREHTDRLRRELTEREEELRRLKQQTGLASIDEQRTQLIGRLGSMEDELIDVESRRAESSAKVESLKRTLADIPKTQVAERTTGIGNEGTDRIRERVFALQMREKEAAAKYTDAHPRLVMIREELAETRAEAEGEAPERTHVKTTPDVGYEATRSALLAEEPVLASLRARSESLKTKVADLRGRLESLSENETRIARLMREIELRDTEYRKYSSNLEQSRIDEALLAQDISNISVVQPATFEPRPIRPRKLLTMALALIVGLGGALGLALGADFMDHSLRTPEDIERSLRLPALVSIPRMNRDALKLNGRN